MKYKVTISQAVKYTNEIIGYFRCDETISMYNFIDNIITHFDEADVTIERINDEEVCQNEPAM